MYDDVTLCMFMDTSRVCVPQPEHWRGFEGAGPSSVHCSASTSPTEEDLSLFERAEKKLDELQDRVVDRQNMKATH